MQHGEPRDFVRLGKFLERTANVTAIVTRKTAELAEAPEDALEWSAVLKSCFAFESYQARNSGGVTPDRVIECLLLDATLPRSARFSAQVALDSVSRIDGPGRRSKPKRLLSRLHSMFGEAGAQMVSEHPREFETEYKAMQRQLELVQEIVDRERRLQGDLATRLLAPVDAIFDLLEQAGATIRGQAEALQDAGRALEESAALMKSQAELFERTIATLRQPAERVKGTAKAKPRTGAKAPRK